MNTRHEIHLLNGKLYDEYHYENLALNSSRFNTGPNSFEGSIEMKLSKL